MFKTKTGITRRYTRLNSLLRIAKEIPLQERKKKMFGHENNIIKIQRRYQVNIK